jgi:NRPS condensation-like uncharacterized protein
MNHEESIQKEPEWFRLDNAAKIYPAVIGGEFTAVFRISVLLREDIVYSALAAAIPVVAARFPYFNVKLSNGIFWFYLERNQGKPRLYADIGEVCTGFPVGSANEVMYRILVKEKELSIEFVHILTDGGGALEFLKTFLYQYLTNTGKISSLPEGIVSPDARPDPAEYEDAFGRHFNKQIPATENPPGAMHLPFSLNRRPRLRLLTAELPSEAVRLKARSYNLTVTEYLASVYLKVLQDIFSRLPGKKGRGIVRVQIPVNLRNHFGSKTMRNFSLFVMPELDLRLGSYSFEDIARSVHHVIRLETQPLRIGRIIRRNVGKERNLLIRILPVFIKKLFLYMAYHTYGSGLNTGVLTNLGNLKLPPEMAMHAEAFTIIPPPPNKKIKINCGVASYGEKMRITFASIAATRELEKGFFRFLSSEGIEVRLIKS